MVQMLRSDDYFASREQTVAVELRIPQSAFPEHTHDFNEIVIVNGGYGKHILNGKPYDLYPGMIYYIQAADHHLYENVRDLHLINILYRSPRDFQFLNGVEQLLPDRQREPDTHWYIDKRNHQNVQALLAALSAQDSQLPVQKESLFLQLLIGLQQGRYFKQGGGSNEEKVHRLLRWLQAHFTDPIDWHELAEQFALPLRTLYRHIKSDTGYTPQRYLTKLRLAEAYYQLCHTDKSITAIAHDCGFNDSAYFSTSFKSEFCVTPRELRDCPSVKNP